MKIVIPKLFNGQVRAYDEFKGFPLVYTTNKGEDVLCPKCVQENLHLCEKDDVDDSLWKIHEVAVNYSPVKLYCRNCGSEIEARNIFNKT